MTFLTSTKTIPTLPTDFTMRVATLDDVPAAVDLFDTYSEHYLGIREFDVPIVETEWQMPKFNPETDIRLGFTPDGKLVGYIEVWTTNNPPVHPWVWGRVHPDYHQMGVGTALLTWGEERAIQAIPNCPEDVRVAFRVGAENSIEPPKALFEKHGMSLIRHSFRMLIEMDSSPPEPVWSEGITVRTPEDAKAEIEAIFRVDNDAFKDHFGYVQQPFEDGLAEFSHWFLNDEQHNDPSLWFLAMDGDKIVGIALCRRKDWENENFGHVSSLGVLRSHRKRGIGLALLHHAFGEYYRRAKTGVTLGVDAENLTGALNLYKKAGMNVDRQFDMYEKELRPGKDISVRELET